MVASPAFRRRAVMSGTAPMKTLAPFPPSAFIVAVPLITARAKGAA